MAARAYESNIRSSKSLNVFHWHLKSSNVEDRPTSKEESFQNQRSSCHRGGPSTCLQILVGLQAEDLSPPT
ncbi:Hypothetical predicted protein [Podarcis lilfordi]|nr:Hypothetical predicted protein [Podarcis lilfordi]